MSIQEKRAKLRALSEQAKDIKERLLKEATTPAEALQVESLRVNDIIINHIYKNEEHHTFHTFGGWLKEGKAVKKGETAFLVWGRPKAVQQAEAAQEPPEDDEDTFFPVSYIFSNAQVKENKKEPTN